MTEATGEGVLYLVATPIGNVADISPRAIEVLSRVDRVLCEDTRRSGRLLARLGIKARLESHHEHNERVRVPRLVQELCRGATLGLVTDAGTPSVSDPGFRLVREAARAGVRIVPIPGPSAVLAALAASGLPTDRFCFLGYLPSRAARRADAIREVATLRATLIFFEAPHRIARTLAALREGLGERDAALCREMTKLHEEIIRKTLGELHEICRTNPERGEITLVVDGYRKPPESADAGGFTGEAMKMYERLRAEGESEAEASKRVGQVFGGGARPGPRRATEDPDR